MNQQITEERHETTVSDDAIAPRLRRRLAQQAQEILDAESESRETEEKLRAELAKHQQAIADAERELGAAALDGKAKSQATQKLQAARDGAVRVEAALTELKRREEEAWSEAWETVVSAERLRGYRWMIDYLDRVAAYLRAQAAAEEAADHLRGLGEVASVANFQTGLWGFADATLFDEELLGATSPRLPSLKEMRERLGESPFSQLTAEDCDRLKEKADSLATAEEAS
jgi:hypothetical protein